MDDKSTKHKVNETIFVSKYLFQGTIQIKRLGGKKRKIQI